MVAFTPEVINTRHFIARDKDDNGDNKNKHRFVICRRLFLTAPMSAKLLKPCVHNMRMTLTRHGFSVSGRVESEPDGWWDNSPPTVAREYTRLRRSDGSQMPTMDREQARKWLVYRLGEEQAALAIIQLEEGEPLDGDERWEALARYGYDSPNQ